jgi:hypothetical protein
MICACLCRLRERVEYRDGAMSPCSDLTCRLPKATVEAHHLARLPAAACPAISSFPRDFALMSFVNCPLSRYSSPERPARRES